MLETLKLQFTPGIELGMVAQFYDPSTGQAIAEGVNMPGQPGQQSKMLSKKLSKQTSKQTSKYKTNAQISINGVYVLPLGINLNLTFCIAHFPINCAFLSHQSDH